MKAVLFPFSHPVLASLAFVLASLVFIDTINAQATRNASAVGRRLDDFNRQSEKAARDELTREMNGRKPTKEELREAQVKKAQIKEDFETLQASYNDIVSRLQAREPLTNSYIAEVTDKISKSGHRLRHNIDFVDKKDDAVKKSAGPTPVPTIKTLCVHLHAFLTSPIFETGVLDVAEAKKASETLEKIIQTSESLRQQIGKID